MKNYELTIFNQSRVIVIVFLLPVFLLGSLYIGLEIMPKNFFWVVSIPIFSGLAGLMYYYVKGDLNIKFNEEHLYFTWKTKLFFNQAHIDSIETKKIKTIVIDQNKLLKKIITSDRILYISNGKLLMKDSQKFINLLVTIINQNEGRIIDSWDVWVEKGYLKWVLIINTLIIFLGLVIIGIFGIMKGFDKIHPASFLMLISILPHIITIQMKLKKKQKTEYKSN